MDQINDNQNKIRQLMNNLNDKQSIRRILHLITDSVNICQEQCKKSNDNINQMQIEIANLREQIKNSN